MQSDTAHLRSETVRLLTIATVAMGFGLFETSFNLEQLLNPSSGPFLLVLSKASAGAYSIFAYATTILTTRAMFFRDSLGSRDLVRHGPFDAMAMTIATVIFIFVLGEIEKAFEAA